MITVIRREVLEALLADSEWHQRLDKAKTSADVERVLVDFCKAWGIKIKLLEVKT